MNTITWNSTETWLAYNVLILYCCDDAVPERW